MGAPLQINEEADIFRSASSTHANNLFGCNFDQSSAVTETVTHIKC